MSLGWADLPSAVTSLAKKGTEKLMNLAQVPLSAVFALREGPLHPQTMLRYGVSPEAPPRKDVGGSLDSTASFFTRESMMQALRRHMRQADDSGQLKFGFATEFTCLVPLCVRGLRGKFSCL